MRTLELSEWKNLRSAYLDPGDDSGYQKDRFAIKEAKSSPEEILAIFSMSDFEVSETDHLGFHLGFLSAGAMLLQTSIIHAHTMNDVKEKKHEALLGAISMDLKNVWRDPAVIPVRMSLVQANYKASKSDPSIVRSVCNWKFDVGEGAFAGDFRGHYGFDRAALPKSLQQT